MQGIEALVEAPETCSVRPSRRSWGTAGEQETGRRGSAPRERQRGGALLRSTTRLSRCGAIAQLGERLLCKQEVAGSSPAGSTLAKCPLRSGFSLASELAP